MAKTTPTPERVSASMYVSLDRPRGLKIEAYLAYHAEWRGDPVAVHLIADRYTVSDGELTPWRMYADTARLGRYRCEATPEGELGAHLTELARRRLGDACRPDAMAWLESDDGAAELRTAFYKAAVRELKDERPYGFHRDAGMRLLDLWGDAMGPDYAARFRPFADAWEAWVVAIAEAEA